MTASGDAVRRAVAAVIDPELRRPLGDLDMIRGVAVTGALARVEVALTIVGCPASDRIERAVCAQFCLRSSVHPATSEKLSLNHLDSDTKRCLLTYLINSALQLLQAACHR